MADAISAYCMKCQTKRDLPDDVEPMTLKNGRPALQAPCPVCETKLTRILGKDDAAARGWVAPPS